MNKDIAKTQDQSASLRLFGMTCTNCAMRIEKGLNKMDGVEEARVNYARETLFVRYSNKITESDLYAKVLDLGYEARDGSSSNTKENQEFQDKEDRRFRIRLIVSAVLSIPLFYTMAAHFPIFPKMQKYVPDFLLNPWVQFALAAPVQFWVGAQFYIGAWKALKNRSANMDVLVALGTSAAFFYSFVVGLAWSLDQESISAIFNLGKGAVSFPHLYYETSAVLITILLFGKLLEHIAKGKSSDAIRGLLELKPQEARIKKGEEFVVFPSEFLKPEDLFLVRPGERIAADGIVEEGESAVDESMITGESLPVDKMLGVEVIGGTMNGNGSLLIRATRTGSDTLLASIVRTVEEAQGSKAPIQRIADSISEVFVPIVVGVAVIDFILWYFLLESGNFTGALEKAIAVLVIACPCALGLATPVSLLVGTGRGARKGILYRNAEALEKASKLDWIGLDKTGTLTEGKPSLDSIISFTKESGIQEGMESSKDLFRYIASLESHSEHPLANALVDEMERTGLEKYSVSNFVSSTGGGVSGVVEGKQVIAGNLAFIKGSEKTPPSELVEYLAANDSKGSSMIWANVGNNWAVIYLRDALKPTSREAIDSLHNAGITPVLLTGDRKESAISIASSANIAEVHSGLLPQGKVEILKSAKEKGYTIGMVGDGINDAPALAVADVSFAMGTGTDIAMESADVVLVHGDLTKLYDAIHLSRLTVRNIKQNFFWALGYNVIGIPIAAMGFLAPWVAGAAMALSSISVVLNALRLKTMR